MFRGEKTETDDSEICLGLEKRSRIANIRAVQAMDLRSGFRYHLTSGNGNQSAHNNRGAGETIHQFNHTAMRGVTIVAEIRTPHRLSSPAYPSNKAATQ